MFEDGRPQKISYFANTEVPLELIAAIDISGSMGPVMPKLKKAVQEFLAARAFRRRGRAFGFDNGLCRAPVRAINPAERVQAVNRMAPWGSTALYDLVLRSVGMLGRQTGRKALVVFTDGGDQGSHATIVDVEHGLQSSNVTLYIISQGRGVTNAPLRAVMSRLVKPTGGRAIFPENIDELRDAFGELLDELSNRVLLGYVPAAAHRDDAWHSIKVEVEGHSEIRARQPLRREPSK